MQHIYIIVIRQLIEKWKIYKLQQNCPYHQKSQISGRIWVELFLKKLVNVMKVKSPLNRNRKRKITNIKIVIVLNVRWKETHSPFNRNKNYYLHLFLQWEKYIFKIILKDFCLIFNQQLIENIPVRCILFAMNFKKICFGFNISGFWQPSPGNF